ncbi:hypothetical protein YC2023_061391 [Brassica napus]
MRTFFDKYFFEIDSFLRKALRRKHEISDKSSKKVASDRASVPLGHYVATELEPSSVATLRCLKLIKEGFSYDEELIESLLICEDNCDLPFPKPVLIFDIDNEETNGLTYFKPEHSSNLVLVSKGFEEEPLDYPHQGPCLDTRRPLDDGLGPIFDEEDEFGPTFDEKSPSMTSINVLKMLSIMLYLESILDVATMAEPDNSSTKDKPGWINGEHTDLKPADETEDELEPAEESMHELKPAEVRVDELDDLSELSDITLELSELSDTS